MLSSSKCFHSMYLSMCVWVRKRSSISELFLCVVKLNKIYSFQTYVIGYSNYILVTKLCIVFSFLNYLTFALSFIKWCILLNVPCPTEMTAYREIVRFNVLYFTINFRWLRMLFRFSMFPLLCFLIVFINFWKTKLISHNLLMIYHVSLYLSILVSYT